MRPGLYPTGDVGLTKPPLLADFYGLQFFLLNESVEGYEEHLGGGLVRLHTPGLVDVAVAKLLHRTDFNSF